MQRILVPTDFSDNALKAITYASEIAQKSDAAIFLLHVIEPAIGMVMDSFAQSNLFMEDVVKERSEQLDLVRKTINENYPGIKVETEVASGTILHSILDFAGAKEVDLIVMGTTGASGLKEMFMGSVAAGIISRTKIPVLTVPVAYEMEPPDAIVLATNQFEKDRKILNPIISVARLFSAIIHVVVFKNTDGDENADYIYNEEQLNSYIHFLKETFPDVIFKGELLEGKDFEITIDRYSNQNEADIIAMITYPKNFFERISGKSVTKKMAFHSTFPLLAIPANR